MKIACLMSGGVDSSVAAFLLKQQGYDVIGVTMRLSSANDCISGGMDKKTCCGIFEFLQARKVCNILGIPHHIVDFSEVFRQKVIDPFIEGYQNGEARIPCSLCNDHIKFDFCYEYCKEKFGVDLIATGHYAEVRDGFLYKTDSEKDQSYFLAGVKKEVLDKTIFPLFGMEKSQTREIARNAGFENSEKRESQDICFIPGGNYRDFLKENNVNFESGNVFDENGKKIGNHNGTPGYTVGQKLLGKFVVNIRSGSNEISVSNQRPTSNSFKIREINIFDSETPAAYVYVRNRCKYSVANFSFDTNTANLSEMALNISPGQRAVFYAEDEIGRAHV